MMTTLDFSPLFRSTVGFERLARLMESALQADHVGQTYPPYNIERVGENAYRITLAVAGFSRDELAIEVDENVLTVSGEKKGGNGANYLHRGIGSRDFLRRFHLADYVEIAGANLADGLLSIDLGREIPEEMKPRRIEIKSGAPKGLISRAKKLIEGASKEAA